LNCFVEKRIYDDDGEQFMNYPKLFSSVKVGSIELKNRTAMAGMGSALPDLDGSVNDKVIAYFGERAKGGAALLITEVVRVCDGHGLAARYQLSAAHDFLIPKMSELAEEVHRYDAKMFFQLHHPGRQTFDDLLNGEPALAPSAIPCPVNRATTRALTLEEIRLLVEQFGDAAARVQKSGIDGVEIHAAHGYLFHQFFSPHTNKRTDEYGGNFENRFRFMKEVIQNIREKCGRGFPLCVRLSVEDFVEGSVPLERGLKIASAVDSLGSVDLINVSVGMYEGSINNMLETASHHQGWRNGILLAAKDAIKNTPVLAVNCVRSPAFAEWMLNKNMCSVAGLARPFLADPEWVNKVSEDREDEIRPCVNCLYCNESTRGNVDDDAERNSCALNVRNCRETIYLEFHMDGNGRAVVIVGAGPAGLEAARVLSVRGFKVILFEKENRIGGQLNIASKPKDKYRYDALVAYYKRQMDLLGVDVRLNTEGEIPAIKAVDPVAVFVSTGSDPIIPSAVQGVDLPNVHTVPEILEEKIVLRNTSVAVVGSGNTGLEVAEYLADRDNVVFVVEMLDEIGGDVYFQNRDDLMKALSGEAVDFLVSHKLVAIRESGIKLLKLNEEIEVFLPVREVVLSLGVKADLSLYERLRKELSVPVALLGDSAKIGRVHDAVYSGFTNAYDVIN
jgi:2,4-dienoyl-CoA reductase-like NADH-dependent reductase (Old Yellow Enzyme family)/thioredoxin reductase